MSPQEIKKQIEAINTKITERANSGTFIFDKEIENLINKRILLRQECKHEFENDECIWCGIRRG